MGGPAAPDRPLTGRDRDLQREINAGLNVSESRNAGNSIIYFGMGGRRT